MNNASFAISAKKQFAVDFALSTARLHRDMTNRRNRTMNNELFEIFIDMLYDAFIEYESGGDNE
jgi:hypothetical protein